MTGMKPQLSLEPPCYLREEIVLEQGRRREFRRLDPVGAAEDVQNRVVVDVEGDVVEHDGDDDFVDIEAGLEEARNGSPERACGHGGQNHQWQVDEARRLDKEGNGRGREAAYHELSLGSDAEEPGPKGEGDGESGQDDGHRLDDELAYVARIEVELAGDVEAGYGPDHGDEHPERGFAGYRHDDRSEEEAEKHRYEGQKQLVGFFRHVQPTLRIEPDIISPSSFSSVLSESTRPTISPL